MIKFLVQWCLLWAAFFEVIRDLNETGTHALTYRGTIIKENA